LPSDSGFYQAERIARLSVVILLATGVIEIGAGEIVRSIAVIADGIDSLSDALISLIVWLGLRVSNRRPDEKFHFGYYKVESYGALIAAIAMIYIAGLIVYRSYLAFLNPRPLNLPIVGLVALLGAGSISFYRARVMKRIASRFNLVSLKVDAKNAIKDGSASFVAFASVLLATLGFHEMDAVGGMIVAGYILAVSYVAIKESSSVLLDAFRNPEVVKEISTIAKNNPGVKKLGNLRLRRSGPYIVGYVEIFMDGKMTLSEVHKVRSEIRESIKQKVVGVQNINVIALPVEAEGTERHEAQTQ